MINVTKSYLPPLQEYIHHLQGIWDRCQLTNYGPLILELEEKLKAFLGVKHLFVVNNGTVALQIAIKALELKGEILTTPFSYVATTASIVWQNCNPVFVDIDPQTFCMDPERIEAAITPKTTAILATHVYGNACDVEAIEAIAQKYHLKVIYDAAHAFHVQFDNESLLRFGDISTLSFHATKLFHTVEGGAIVTNDDALAEKIAPMCNFGHDGPENFNGLGTNAKLSEFHAAMGLCILPTVNELIQKRKALSALYDEALADLPLKRPVMDPRLTYNYAYYPVLFPSEEILIQTRQELNASGIFPRRYFYPSLSKLNYVEQQTAANAEDIASRILCLPLSHDLAAPVIHQIADVIQKQFVRCELL